MFQNRANFPFGEDAIRDITGLISLITYADQFRALGRMSVRPEILGETLLGETNDCVRRCKNRKGRPIVPIQRNDFGGRAELAGKVENVPNCRRPERIDRLCIVTDNRQPDATGPESQKDRGLQSVRILVFVNQGVVETGADIIGEYGVADSLRPEEQEIIVIENMLPLLCLDVV